MAGMCGYPAGRLIVGVKQGDLTCEHLKLDQGRIPAVGWMMYDTGDGNLTSNLYWPSFISVFIPHNSIGAMGDTPFMIPDFILIADIFW